MKRESTNLSPQQASVLPPLNFLKPGSVIGSETLKIILHAIPHSEFCDVNEFAYNYIQRVDWELYANKKQIMSSEYEYTIAALLNHDPDTSLKLQTLSDIFHIKSKGGHFRTRSQKIQFLQKYQQLKSLKYNSRV